MSKTLSQQIVIYDRYGAEPRVYATAYTSEQVYDAIISCARDHGSYRKPRAVMAAKHYEEAK